MGSSSDDEARPEPQTQYKEWKNAEVSDLKLGETWYAIDQKWLDGFLNYIKGGVDGRPAREPAELDNRALVWDASMMQSKYDNMSNTNDSEFIEALQKHKKREHVLKRGVVEGRDFTFVSEAQKGLLRNWYHGGPYVGRKVVAALCGTIVELYPLQLWAQLDKSEESKRPMLVSRTWPMEKLWELACKEVGADESKEARLVPQGEGAGHGMILDRSETRSLEELDVDDFSMIVFSERRDRRGGLYSAGSSISRIDIEGPLPCPPPVSATGMSATGIDIIGSMDEDDNRLNSDIPQGVISRGKGLCGLGNMGNTCFMNSSLQCLSNSELLTRYFISGQWRRDLNTDNALGYSGTLAQEYAKLLGEIWSKQESLYPRSFKSMIARYAPQFTGYSQHDSQELLAFLLDGLHEDTNKIRKKPPTETPTGDGTNDAAIAALSWERYKMRNDSVVLDLFSGQYHSELVCPECNNVSVTFDPFNNITVQLPQSNSVNVSVTFHALDPLTPPAKVDLFFSRSDTVKHVKAELARQFHCTASRIAVAEVFYSDFRSFHDNSDKLWEYGRPQLDGDTHAYEVDTTVPPSFNDRSNSSSSSYGGGFYGSGGAGFPVQGPEDGASKKSVVLKVLLRKAEKKSSFAFHDSYDCTDTPFVISLPTDSPDVYRTLRLRLCCKMARRLKEPWRSKFGRMLEEEGGFARASSNQMQEDAMMMDMDSNETAGFGELLEGAFVIRKIQYARQEGTELGDYSDSPLEDRQMIAVDWTQEGLDRVVDQHAEDQPQSLSSGRSAQNEGAASGTTVEQCLKLFTTPEVLSEQDTWFCSNCKNHVRATKTMGLWKLPNLLVIHLKRFSDQGWSREKVDTLVRFPTEGLDMSPYVKGPQEDGTVYDLYAVSNHFGGAGFGHYTAFCKSPGDGKWYNFDDTSVRPCSVESVVSPAAYVLFYQRRGAAPPESLLQLAAGRAPPSSIRSS